MRRKDNIQQTKDILEFNNWLHSFLNAESKTELKQGVLLLESELGKAILKHIYETNRALAKMQRSPIDLWMTHKEAQRFFGVSASTLRSWRLKGLLGYSQRDRVIMIHFSDIEKFLKHHKQEAFQYK